MGPCGREVSGARAHHRLRASRTNGDLAPGSVALEVLRVISDEVLGRELVRNLAVDARELSYVVHEEDAAAGDLRERPQGEVRLTEASALSRKLLFAQADGVDCHVRL